MLVYALAYRTLLRVIFVNKTTASTFNSNDVLIYVSDFLLKIPENHTQNVYKSKTPPEIVKKFGVQTNFYLPTSHPLWCEFIRCIKVNQPRNKILATVLQEMHATASTDHNSIT